MRVWDAFCYNGEVGALHARLALPGVDRRVVVEAWLTHSGELKHHLFYQWQLPNVRLVTPDLSGCTGCWDRENTQRNAIMQGLEGAAADDVILIGDVDEIVSEDGLTRALHALKVHKAVVLEQTMFNYNRKWKDPRGWRGTVATTYAHLQSCSPQSLRDAREHLPRVPRAGEHDSWSGGTQDIVRKLRSFAHEEYRDLANDTALIERRIACGEDLFGRWPLEKA